MNRSALSILVLSLVVASSLSSCSTVGVRRAKVVPQRPRIGNTTQTTAFGTFEVEAGAGVSVGNSAELSTRIKSGVSPTAEFFADIAPYRYYDVAGPNADGVGDLTLGFRQRLMNESKNYPATAFELAVQLPTGDTSLNGGTGLSGGADSTGFTNVFGAFILDRTFDTLYTTVNYQFGALGSGASRSDDPGFGSLGTPKAGDNIVQHRGSVAASLPIYEKLRGLGELAFFYVSENGYNPLILNLAAQYAISDTLQFDAGALIGLNRVAEDMVFRVGFTTNLGIFF